MACQNTFEDSFITDDKSFEPGAARFGNFINYYNFNSVSKRLKVIPYDFISHLGLNSSSILCLDIGCNSGEMTVGFYSHLISNPEVKAEIFMLGIDLDSILITRCNQSNPYPNNITFQEVNVMADSAMAQLQSFLEKHKRSEFDLVTCFSTTMWIHLNHGDNGLDSFLQNISRITRFLLLEPQEWKSYKSAVRRMTRLKQELFALDKLKTRDVAQHITEFLSDEGGMNLNRCYGETSWGRKLYLLQRKNLHNHLI